MAEERSDLEAPFLNGEDLEDSNWRSEDGNWSDGRLKSSSQVALVGSKLCPIESLDYEAIENDISFKLEQDWRGRGRSQIFQYVLLKWTLCFLLGLIVGAIGFFNNLAVENLAGVKFVVTSNLMLSRQYGWAFAVFAASNFVLVIISSLITCRVAPAAAGSGIPEVKAYLNGIDSPKILSSRTLIVKIIGSILVVSSSLHIGKAGPMIHTGACVASLLSQGGSKKYHLTWKWLKYFKNDRDRRDLVTCGAAAGVAAAFRAPVGGVLFALEAVSSWWRSALLWRSFFTTAMVTVVLRALIDVCRSGKCGLFGKGGLIMFDVTSDNIIYHLTDLPAVIVLGIFGGILGSFHNYLLEKVLLIYRVINGRGTTQKLLLAGTMSLFTSCCLFGLPWLANCKPCPVGAEEICPTIGRSGNFKKFQCPPGHYNDLASLFFNTNDDTIRNLFSSGTDHEFNQFSILLFFVASYVLGILSYGVVAPSGLFVPIILAGATYGRWLGMAMGSHSSLDQGLFAVLGAASLLGGSMRMTVSVCVIVLELTNNLLLLPLVMLVLVISKITADAFNPNIYDLIIKLKGLPYLEDHADPYMKRLKVGDVVSGPLQCFNAIESVGSIVHTLKSTGHNAFPVVDSGYQKRPTLHGLILRSHLLVLLRNKAFVQNLKQFSWEDFAKPGSDKEDNVEGIGLTDEEMEMYVDLRPFANTSPYTVVESMSLAKALVLFRQLGLRHLLVVPKCSSRWPVVGILTRHDFMPEHVLGLHPHLCSGGARRLRFSGASLSKYFTGMFHNLTSYCHKSVLDLG